MPSLNVFISSRELEMEPEREIAAEVVDNISMMPIRHEISLVPQPVAPYEAYLAGVDRCDLFVLMLWKTRSAAVVEEYTRARRRGKPILCLVKSIKSENGETRDSDLAAFIQQVAADGWSMSSFR